MRVRVASAGTGKTTSLVLRYLELLTSGLPLRRIAGVTFTRSAATELRLRVGEGIRTLLATGEFIGARLDPACRPVLEEALLELEGATLTTIHGFMVEALRLTAPVAGIDPDFSVLAEWEAQALFEEELRSTVYLAADPAHPLHGVVARVGPDAERHLSRLFRQRSLVEAFSGGEDERARDLARLFTAVYTGYENRLGSRALALGEVERKALRLLGSKPAVKRLVGRFRLVLVDEFQDVNPLQGRFFEALEEAGLEVEVVGDPKQSIYGFRNAEVEVFRRARRRGVELPPLDRSYRHCALVSRFLNRLTSTLAAAGMGFDASEAPQVTSAGDRSALEGRVEVHWVKGPPPLDRLRRTEATVLARRLRALHEERSIAYRDMAVLARSHASLAIVETALRDEGLPAVLLQGRGFFERTEIRDLYNALRAGVEPSGVAFAAWLRGPFGGLEPRALAAVLAAEDPVAALERVDPIIARRYRRLREIVVLPPLTALKTLIREPLVDDRSFVHFLDSRQRENVDALLFSVARAPAVELEALLERLQLLTRQTESGDVPQTGDGIALLTIHAAKGLEWRVAALFDISRGGRPGGDPLRIDPETGLVAFAGTPEYDEVGRRLAERERNEGYRLFYVAASRPREVLIITGSHSGRPQGWTDVLERLGMGPQARERSGPEFLQAVHEPEPGPARGGATPVGRVADPREGEWTDSSFAPHPYPPVLSPSRIGKVEHAPPSVREERGDPSITLAPSTGPVGGSTLAGPEDGEPVPPGEGDSLGEIPGRSTTVGTLVHYAISQSWRPDNAQHLANLRAQEVMFPFDPEEQDGIMAEVAELLEGYWAMVGRELPEIGRRSTDHAELPMLLPEGPTVWQGIIDRLYRVDGIWFLDDYKTDRRVVPEHYATQLALYAEAVRRVREVEPRVRLVYLRARKVVELEREVLDEAFARIAAGKPVPVPS